jgi:FkbM family methyltransferase
MKLLDRISDNLHALVSPRVVSTHGFPNAEFDPQTHQERVQRWQQAGNDERLRTHYPTLGPDSVVLDLGGFEGDFALLMNAKYGSRCHVFEVVPDLCEGIRTRCAGNPKITVHAFGLAGSTRQEDLFLADEGSSTFADRSSTHRQIRIQLVAADEWFRKHLGTAAVELMKINIEGGEYELLEHLIENDLHKRVANIQVQFHEDVIAGAGRRMDRIHSRLAKTHRLTYQERFVWENWELARR